MKAKPLKLPYSYNSHLQRFETRPRPSLKNLPLGSLSVSKSSMVTRRLIQVTFAELMFSQCFFFFRILRKHFSRLHYGLLPCLPLTCLHFEGADHQVLRTSGNEVGLILECPQNSDILEERSPQHYSNSTQRVYS